MYNQWTQMDDKDVPISLQRFKLFQKSFSSDESVCSNECVYMAQPMHFASYKDRN